MYQNWLPTKPYCTDKLSDGLKILPLALALQKKYIQINPPSTKSFLIFDVDRPGAALAAEDAGLPPPSLCVVNPVNLHAHLLYALSNPICTSANGRAGPQRYYKAVEWAYGQRLGADPAYSGLIAKNPWSPAWWTMEDGNAVYDLTTMADYVELPAKIPKRANTGGRNCTLFDTLRAWAYKAIRGYWRPDGEAAWYMALLAEAQSLNDFPEALPAKEVRYIARSVARWTWRHTTPQGLGELIRATHTPELQRARINKRWEKESKRAQGLALLQAGASREEVIQSLSVSEATVKRWGKTLQPPK
jgi:hypothetical protein